MNLKHLAAVSIAAITAVSFAQNPLDQIKGLAQESSKVKLDFKQNKRVLKANQPPYCTDNYTFVTPSNKLTVYYHYFMNQPPEFTGKHPALLHSQGGIGLSGKSFAFWYYGGMIRIYVNNIDIMQQKIAKVSTKCGKNGNIEFVWNWGKASKFTLQLIVPSEGNRVYARLIPEISPLDKKVNHIKIRLTGYPGGFGPAYKQPSHRYVKLSDGKEEILDAGKIMKKQITLPGDVKWAFLADKLQKKGAIGFVLEKIAGGNHNLNLSSYGSSFLLNYQGCPKAVNFALYAFETTNEVSFNTFKNRASSDYQEMLSIKYGE